jgi:A/G-specific adenine glycosylase
VKRTQRRLLQWYRRSGRSGLPWRVARNPYYTVISEFMLAQTQVDRVTPKFQSFVERFPDFASLAKASVADVLREWKGLGYNPRAVRLKRLADTVVERYGGTLPSEREQLRALPGVGAYTVAAIRAFAFNIDDVPMDTNLQRIVHRVFFGVEHPPMAAARELHARARAFASPGHAHDWNSALMDLGATICTARTPKCLLCPLRPDCAAAPIDAAKLDRLREANLKPRSPQNAIPYEQTIRYARGRIIDWLRDLPPGRRISLLDLHYAVAPAIPGRSLEELVEFVGALERDGLVTRDGNQVALRE